MFKCEHVKCKMDFPSIVLLLLRVFVGLVFVLHGVSKAANLADFGGLIESISIPLPMIVAGIVAYFEIIGGVLLILGLWTRIVGSIFVLEMIIVLFVGFLSNKLILPPISVEYNSLMLLTVLYLVAAAQDTYGLCCFWQKDGEPKSDAPAV